MKIATYTTHSIIPTGTGDTENDFEVFIDSDSTVQLRFGLESEGRRSRWMDREELMALRRAITKALRLIP